MENTLGRRNTRSHYHPRRKRSSYIEEKNRISKILRQLIVCGAIFVIIFTVKNIDSSFTNYLSSKTAAVLTADTEFNALINQINGMFSSLNITNEKLKAVFNNQGIIQDQNSSVIPDEMKDKIYDANLLKDIAFEKPVTGNLVSTFGSRISPITKQNEFHEGIDISAKTGDDIKVILDGVVVEAKNDPTLGNYVKVRHDGDLYSLYAHASSLTVEKGQEVKKGDVIAKVGSTGASTGEHLHLEMQKGEMMVDPQKIFNFGSGVDNVQ